MKHIYFLFIAVLLAFNSSAKTAINEQSNCLVDKLTNKEVFLKYIAEKEKQNEAINPVDLAEFYAQLKNTNKVRTQNNHLKSATTQDHKIDSLLVERWNETTGKLEPAQLEKWIWYENGLGESWELYDLDTVTQKWFPNDKEEYTWDANGNKTIHLDFDPDSTSGGWLINAQIISTYNSNGDEITALTQVKNRTTNEWEDYDKTINTYDTNFNLTKVEYSDWDTTQNDWICNDYIRLAYDENGFVNLREFVFDKYYFHSKSEMISDSNGNEIQLISSDWDYTNNMYIYTLKNSRSFSSDEDLVRFSQYTWDTDSSDWKIKWEVNYEYDDDGFLIYRDRFDQDNVLDSLIMSWKNDYINNTDGNLITKTSMLWDTTSNAWTNNYQDHYEYDSEKRQNYMDRYTWDTITNDWMGSYNEIHNYDNSGNHLLHSKQNYDKESDQWLDEFIEGHTYDLNIDFSNICFTSEWLTGHLSNLYFYDQFNNAMLQKVYSERKNEQMVPTEKFTFYYSENISTGYPEIVEGNVRVFPNPATDFVMFDGLNSSIPTSIEIYDLQGRKAITKLLDGKMRVNVSNLQSGVYVYHITSGGETTVGKLVIK